jgi:biopolymer transport protein ExbD
MPEVSPALSRGASPSSLSSLIPFIPVLLLLLLLLLIPVVYIEETPWQVSGTLMAAKHVKWITDST